jgi:predicted N-acetyltransferase YhbS/VanZ family protein
MQSGYRLRAAEERDLAALPDIEQRASAAFADYGIAPSVLEATRTPAELARARDALWVAVDDGDRVVGFALVRELASGVHLDELDVDPDHGRRGIGTALVEHVCEVARRRGYEYVTLATYARVPWNAPYYERLGFRVLAAGELPPALREVVEEETLKGFDPGIRVAMARRVDPHRPFWRWTAALWMLALFLLSALATTRPLVLLRWTPYLPGRDKTGHFLLMGGFAGVAVLGFAGRRIGTRRISAEAIVAGVVVLVAFEEGIQYWLPRRSFSLEDLLWSLIGVVCFGGMAALWRAHRSSS